MRGEAAPCSRRSHCRAGHARLARAGSRSDRSPGCWAEDLPHLGPSLAPLVEGPGRPDAQPADALLTAGGVVEGLLDARSPLQSLAHMREISSLRRQRAGVTPEALRGSAQRRSAARLLFQHAPYSCQERLTLSASDVAAVVEAVAGPRPGGGPSALTGRPEVASEADARFWAALPAGSSSADSLGQAAGCVLIKLTMDLWLAGGPEAAAPLALRLVQQALQQPLPAHRARAFDLIYNLSLHGSLLRRAGESPPPSPGQPSPGGGAVNPPGPATARASVSSPRAQLHIGGAGVPQLPSPRIHLPAQLLAPSSPTSMHSRCSPSSPVSMRSATPPSPAAPASPLGSRLARSAAWDAEPAPRAGGSTGEAAADALCMELALERWLLGLACEALLMLTQVRLCRRVCAYAERVSQGTVACACHRQKAQEGAAGGCWAWGCAAQFCLCRL